MNKLLLFLCAIHTQGDIYPYGTYESNLIIIYNENKYIPSNLNTVCISFTLNVTLNVTHDCSLQIVMSKHVGSPATLHTEFT